MHARRPSRAESSQRRVPSPPHPAPRKARSGSTATPNHQRNEGDSTHSGSLRVPGQAVLRPLRHPGLPGRRGRHRRRGSRAGRGGRLPGGGQGAGEGRWSRQGGWREAGRRRRRGPAPRWQHPGPRHQGPRRHAPLGRARVGHLQGVLRQLHPGPSRQAAPRDAERGGRGRDRGGSRDESRRHRPHPRRSRGWD